jgi:hypothetical protein
MNRFLLEFFVTTATKLELVRWHRADGAFIHEGEAICEATLPVGGFHSSRMSDFSDSFIAGVCPFRVYDADMSIGELIPRRPCRTGDLPACGAKCRSFAEEAPPPS